MYTCHKCTGSIDPARLRGRDTCPDCGARLLPNSQPAWIDVARVSNLAEAGFLTDELVGLGIDARIYQLQEFSAANDRWGSLYLIRVPAAGALDAAARIRQHMAEDGDEGQTQKERWPSTGHEGPTDPLLWRP